MLRTLACFSLMVFFASTPKDALSSDANRPELQAIIQVSNAVRLGVFLGDSWTVRRLSRDDGVRVGSPRHVALPARIRALFAACFSGYSCPSRIDIEEVKIQPEESPSDVHAVTVLGDLLVVRQSSSPVDPVAIIDLGTGAVRTYNRYGEIVALSAQPRGVYVTHCSGDMESCKVRFQGFDDPTPSLGVDVDAQIADMRVVGESLQLLVSRRLEKKLDPWRKSLEALGHPVRIASWWLLEISIKDGMRKEHLLQGEVANAYGHFVCKWCEKN